MADITPIASLNGELAMPEKVWMQGPPGAAATVTVGTVTTGEPGTDALVTNSGTENAAVLNFAIPRGETGPSGAGVPDGGTAGQLLSKTESGTAWIEPPQSGVQPDWNQNDATQPDYVRNRPVYTGDPVETVLVEESTAPFSENGGLYIAEVPSTFDATVGEAYKVSWDGTVYECICGNLNKLLVLGNLSIIGAGSDTGEPFLVSVINGSGIIIYTTDTSDSHTFSISGLVTEVVKIDEKYLPDTVATKSEVEVAHNKANAAQNKANAAQSTANTAKSTADAAQSTANTAKTTADAAQTTAETAQTTANGCVKKSNTGKFGINLGSNNAFSGSVQSSAVNYSFMTNDITNTPTNLNIGALGGTALKISVTPSTSPTVKITPPVYGGNQADIEFAALTKSYSAPQITGLGGITMCASTPASTKKFKITVDDSGTISATEVTS